MNPQPSIHAKRHIWTRRQIAMLGTISDAALSRKLDLSISTVFKKRQKLGIPASRPPKSINWTPAIIALLGKIPDAAAAASLDLAPSAVRLKRIALGIPPFGRSSSH